MIKYETKVIEINEYAEDFLKEKMLVVFGPDAPPELSPYCYIIEHNEINDEVKEGDTLLLDNEEYSIINVGDAVNKNLKDLAHITFNFKGKEEAKSNLAGTIYLEDKNITDLKVGSTIKIRST